MIRSTLLETMNEDFVRTARAKGLSELAGLRRHTLRASTLPLVAILTMDAGVAFGAAMFVERVFQSRVSARSSYSRCHGPISP